MAPEDRPNGQSDQQRRIQMAENLGQGKFLMQPCYNMGGCRAVTVTLEMKPKGMAGDEQAQGADRTLRKAGAARAWQGLGEEDRDEWDGRQREPCVKDDYFGRGYIG